MAGNFKVILLVLSLQLFVGGAYAFATQTTEAVSPAVYETSMVFGYDVTGIIFELNENDPTLVDAITFNIAPSHGSAQADQVMIQTEPEGAWTECLLREDVLPKRAATCTFGSLAAEEVTALNIVAR